MPLWADVYGTGGHGDLPHGELEAETAGWAIRSQAGIPDWALVPFLPPDTHALPFSFQASKFSELLDFYQGPCDLGQPT